MRIENKLNLINLSISFTLNINNIVKFYSQIPFFKENHISKKNILIPKIRVFFH